MFLSAAKSGTFLCVLYRDKLWAKFKGFPIIRLYVCPSVPAEDNYLKTPYRGGFPDVYPSAMNLHRPEQIAAKREKGILVSMKMPAAQLYAVLREIAQSSDIAILYVNAGPSAKPEESATRLRLPNDNTTLEACGLYPKAKLTLSGERVKQTSAAGPLLGSVQKPEGIQGAGPAGAPSLRLQQLPVLQEELFEDVEEEELVPTLSSISNQPVEKKEEVNLEKERDKEAKREKERQRERERAQERERENEREKEQEKARNREKERLAQEHYEKEQAATRMEKLPFLPQTHDHVQKSLEILMKELSALIAK